MRVSFREQREIKMDTTKTARIFLGLNAAFSLVIGVGFILASNGVSQLLFTQSADWQATTILILGIGLIIFGLDLVIMATNRLITKNQVMFIIIMDIGWVIVSILLIFLENSLFTAAGQTSIIVVSLFVVIFATGQFVGARKIVAFLSDASVVIKGDKLQAIVKRSVNAPTDVVWRVMNDHPSYSDVADNISKVEVVSGDGLGMQRRCYGLKGENWTETCDLFEDGYTYGFKVHTDAADYPYPISELEGRWSVVPHGSGSQFTIDIHAIPKGNFLYRTMFRTVAKRRFKTILIDLANAWAKRMEHEAQT